MRWSAKDLILNEILQINRSKICINRSVAREAGKTHLKDASTFLGVVKPRKFVITLVWVFYESAAHISLWRTIAIIRKAEAPAPNSSGKHRKIQHKIKYPVCRRHSTIWRNTALPCPAANENSSPKHFDLHSFIMLVWMPELQLSTSINSQELKKRPIALALIISIFKPAASAPSSSLVPSTCNQRVAKTSARVLRTVALPPQNDGTIVLATLCQRHLQHHRCPSPLLSPAAATARSQQRNWATAAETDYHPAA